MKRLIRRGFTHLRPAGFGEVSPTRLRRAAFTLVELLVVIVIIAILASLLVVLIKGMIDKSRNTATKALIDILNKGCESYKIDEGLYPPSSPYSGSQNLHFYLGGSRLYIAQYGATAADNITAQRPPLVEFKREWLDPSASSTFPNPPTYVYDRWEKQVQYQVPGVNNPKSVDIWSKGKNDTDAGDDLANWIRDY
jgi:prepilin-type N-terminal cleavage/methylation domain-containing protein